MPVAKDKVMAAIETKFKGKSLTKNFKEQIASSCAEKIEDEAGIDAYIEDREDLILAASTEGDRRATAAAKTAKQEAADAIDGKKTDPAPEIQQTQTPADMPEWMKPFMTQMQTLSNTVAGMQQEKQAQSITQRFLNDPRVKGIPEVLLKGRIPTSEEQFEAAAEEVKSELAPLAAQLGANGFGNDTPVAPVSTSSGAKPKEASAQEIDALVGQMRL